MAVFIELNESVASRRCVPMWCVQSNGTSAATNESGASFFFSIGGVDYGSGGSLSAISANAGLYSANFAASKVSVVGQGFTYYSSGTALPTMTPFMITAFDSFDSMRLGLFALPNAGANTTGGLPLIGNDYGSTLTVGVSNIKAAAYSGVTVGAGNFAPGVYSGVSFSVRDSGIATTSYQPGNYSGVSFEVKSGGIQTTSIGAGNYSGVSVEIKPLLVRSVITPLAASMIGCASLAAEISSGRTWMRDRTMAGMMVIWLLGLHSKPQPQSPPV